MKNLSVVFLTYFLFKCSLARTENNYEARIDTAVKKAVVFLETSLYSSDASMYSGHRILKKLYNVSINVNDSLYVPKLNDDEYKEWYVYSKLNDTVTPIEPDCLEENNSLNIVLKSLYFPLIKPDKNYLKTVEELSSQGIYDLLHMYWVLRNVEPYYESAELKTRIAFKALDSTLYTKIYNAFFLTKSMDIFDEKVEAAAFVLMGNHKNTISSAFIDQLLNQQYENGSWCFMNSDCDNFKLDYLTAFKTHNTFVALMAILQWRKNMQ